MPFFPVPHRVGEEAFFPPGGVEAEESLGPRLSGGRADCRASSVKTEVGEERLEGFTLALGFSDLLKSGEGKTSIYPQRETKSPLACCAHSLQPVRVTNYLGPGLHLPVTEPVCTIRNSLSTAACHGGDLQVSNGLTAIGGAPNHRS